MGIFGKRQKQPALPGNIVNMMERFGHVEFDPQGSGEDIGTVWMELQWPLQPFTEADPEGFLIALANAIVPVGGWAAYGASRTLYEFFSSKTAFHQHPAYVAIMDAAIEFLRANRVPPLNVRPYEWAHWMARGGTRETWEPQTTAPTPTGGQRSPEAWVEIGDAHAENAHYTEALAAYDLAIKLDSTYAPAYSHKADIFGEMHLYEQALFFYDLAIRLNPANAGSYAGKGLALGNLQRYQEALEAYGLAIKLSPTIAAGYADKGVILTAMGRYEEALMACDQALQVNPNYSWAYVNKGTVLAELNRDEEALENYERAFQLNPSDTGACVGKGLMLSRLNRHTEALDTWNTVIQRKPSALAYTHQGLALAALNRQTEALDAYNYALQLDPNDTSLQAWRQQLLTRLQQNR